MTNAMAGSVFSVSQFGSIASGVLRSALTDRLNTRNIFLVSILWSGTANLLFALFAHDYVTAMLFRALTGVGMGLAAWTGAVMHRASTIRGGTA